MYPSICAGSYELGQNQVTGENRAIKLFSRDCSVVFNKKIIPVSVRDHGLPPTHKGVQLSFKPLSLPRITAHALTPAGANAMARITMGLTLGRLLPILSLCLFVLVGCVGTNSHVPAQAILDEYRARNAALSTHSTIGIGPQVGLLESGAPTPVKGEAVEMETDDETNISAYEVRLSALGAAEAVELLTTVFASKIDNGDFSAAARAGANTVYLRGQKSLVVQALDIMRRADNPPRHVVIEALVVEFNKERLTDFGSQLSDGTTGNFANIFLDLAASGGNVIFSYDSLLSASSKSFTLALDLFEEHSIARVLSRPYLSTRSGKAASMDISEDRFVETKVGEDVELTEVSSGISVKVTPIVTRAGDISMEFTVEESRFATTEEEGSNRRTRNSVTSSAIVSSGRTIVIGGLSLNSHIKSEAGVRGASRLGPLKFLFGHESTATQNTEVMIMLTPRVWEPGMNVPVPTEESIRAQATLDALNE